MEGSEAFLLDVLLLGVSCFLYLVCVELEKVGDDFGFGRVVRKAVAKMAAFPVNAAITGKAAF